MMILLFLATVTLTAQGWFEQGIQKHDAGDYQGALEAYAKAVELNFQPRMQLSLRRARARAQVGEKESAFRVLQQLVTNGYSQVDQLNAENELIPLRSDPRWKDIVAGARKNARPCENGPEFRQFDYWLGEWDVETNGQKIATSSIQLILNECAVFENYFALSGYSGKSFSVWDAMEKRWEQQYVDTNGGARTWLGALEGDKMVFYLRGQGPAVNRMSYIREGPDKVRQLIELSTDGEKTWAVGYNGLYVRRK